MIVKVKLSDICSIQAGGTPSRSNAEYWENGTIPWVKISDIKQKYLIKTEEYINENGLSNSSAKIFSKGTILFTIFATLGEVCILDIDAATNQAIAGITIDSDNVDRDYLYHYLRSKKTYVNFIGRGVAQNNINMGILRGFEILLPPLSKQHEIATILGKLDDLISLRKQQLAKLDELVKARFVEMFGDMLLNPLSWSEKPLENMADIVSGITKGRKTQSTEFIEVPYMAVSNVKDGYIDWTTVKMIMATQAEIDQYRLLPDDVLMTEGGDPDKLGRGAIIREPLKNCIHQNHIFRVRLNRKAILPEFFAEYLQHQKSKRYFLRCAKQTTGIASINMKQLRALPVLLPPIGIQEIFADFIAGVERQKLTIQQSLDKLEVLRKSLMQEYFG